VWTAVRRADTWGARLVASTAGRRVYQKAERKVARKAAQWDAMMAGRMDGWWVDERVARKDAMLEP